MNKIDSSFMSLVGLLRANRDQNETNPVPNAIAMHIVSNVPGKNWSNHNTSVLLHLVWSYYFSSTFHFSRHDSPQSWYIIDKLSTNYRQIIDILSTSYRQIIESLSNYRHYRQIIDKLSRVLAIIDIIDKFPTPNNFVSHPRLFVKAEKTY
jgi:hypothetical protein